MKKQVAILLLLCYSLALVKPLVPAFSDFFAHSFFKTEHLATVHFENGKYHLHIDMEKAGKNDQQNDPKKTSEKNELVHLNPAVEQEIIPALFCGFITSNAEKIPSNLFRPVASPPPWQC